MQPLIDPLYGGHTAHDVLQTLLSEPLLSSYEAVRETWRPAPSRGDFELGWRKALHAGWIDGHQVRYRLRKAAASTPINVPTPAPRGCDRNHLPPRPQYLRRALCERGLAAGVAQAGNQPELGQRGHRVGCNPDKARARRRRHRGDHGGRRQGEGAGDRGSRPSRQLGDGVSRLRSRGGGPGRARGRASTRISSGPPGRRSTPPGRSRRSKASGASPSPRATTRTTAARHSQRVRQPEPFARSRRSAGPARHHPLRHA